MRRMFPLLIMLCLIVASPFALAQENRIEVNGQVGYTLSSGIDIDLEIDDISFNRVSPVSGFSYGAGLDIFLSEGFSLGFNWSQQDSKLRGGVRAGSDIDFTDMTVSNYHGIFTYNFGDEDSPIRPYLFGGLGATHYSPNDIDGSSVDSSTNFSTTWGGGVKFFPSEHFGFRGGLRWTPTYIGSTDAGYWCGFYGCWIVSEAHYSHQFEMSGGIIARF